MNAQKLKECIFYRVRLRPIALSSPPRLQSADNDDVWIIIAVRQGGVVELSNIATGHVAKLGSDHIHHFDTDPMSETDGLKHGFLNLKVQLVMKGRDFLVEPLPPNLRREPA